MIDEIIARPEGKPLDELYRKLEEYNKERNNILSKRIQERKDLRNLQWYIKRLRPRYLKLIIEGRRNKEKYIKNIKQYI